MTEKTVFQNKLHRVLIIWGSVHVCVCAKSLQFCSTLQPHKL